MSNETDSATVAATSAPTEPDAPAAPPVPDSLPTTGQPGTSLICPQCQSPVTADQSFCEACGSELSPTIVAPPPAAGLESPITLSSQVRPESPAASEDSVEVARPCQSCGGVVGTDGYCETCGTKAVSLRDHYTEQPSGWVAACCDRGLRHPRNEDASAVASDPQPGTRAVLVVCDGVSTSLDSDVASLAGARAARDILEAQRAVGLGTPASRAAAMTGSLGAAAARANTAVVDNTAVDSDNAASCTFAAAVIDGNLVAYGNVGDSRVYWVPDLGQPDAPQELSLDDSVAQFRISAGVTRAEAEAGPQAHAITKWLGRDSPDFMPRTGSITVTSTGWLLVCSDGLWNYVSEAAGIQALMAELGAETSQPLPLAEALVTWANAQGGKDNISVALARYVPPNPGA